MSYKINIAVNCFIALIAVDSTAKPAPRRLANYIKTSPTCERANSLIINSRTEDAKLLSSTQLNIPLCTYVFASANHEEQNYSVAMRYFRIAAAAGMPDAYFQIGYMYANGQGVPVSYALALRYYRASLSVAKQGGWNDASGNQANARENIRGIEELQARQNNTVNSSPVPQSNCHSEFKFTDAQGRPVFGMSC